MLFIEVDYHVLKYKSAGHIIFYTFFVECDCLKLGLNPLYLS
jgi:hypothetical protein